MQKPRKTKVQNIFHQWHLWPEFCLVELLWNSVGHIFPLLTFDTCPLAGHWRVHPDWEECEDQAKGQDLQSERGLCQVLPPLHQRVPQAQEVPGGESVPSRVVFFKKTESNFCGFEPVISSQKCVPFPPRGSVPLALSPEAAGGLPIMWIPIELFALPEWACVRMFGQQPGDEFVLTADQLIGITVPFCLRSTVAEWL